MDKDRSIQEILQKFSPEAQAIAKDTAKLRVESKMLKKALSMSQQQYAQLFAFILAILRQMPNHEIRFKSSDFEQYAQFAEAWTLLSEHDDVTDEQVLRLVEKGVKDAS